MILSSKLMFLYIERELVYSIELRIEVPQKVL